LGETGVLEELVTLLSLVVSEQLTNAGINSRTVNNKGCVDIFNVISMGFA
jgi:hypothetical protein